MVGDFVRTVYGAISCRFAKSALIDVCVSKSGVQTGPFGSQLHASDYIDDGTPIITVEHLGENRIVHNNLPRVTDEDKKGSRVTHSSQVILSSVELGLLIGEQ